MCSGRVSSSCYSHVTLVAKPVISHEFGKDQKEICIWTIMQSLHTSLHVQSRGIAINQIHIFFFQYRKLFDLTINQIHIFFQYRKRFGLTFLYILLQTEKSSKLSRMVNWPSINGYFPADWQIKQGLIYRKLIKPRIKLSWSENIILEYWRRFLIWGAQMG